jgi:predicted KAP-like P-loop ATPase
LSDTDPQNLVLSADRPLHDAHRDALGHAVFAHHLARLVTEHVPAQGLTVGVFGSAGSGRSTVLNLTRSYLELGGQWSILDWNPWLAGDSGPLEASLLQAIATITLPSAASKADGADKPEPAKAPLPKAKILGPMSGGSRQLVVFVDDVSRLSPPEQADLARAVSAMSGTPNLVFVMIFDREDTITPLVEKLVNVPIDIPEPDREALQQLFVDMLKPVLDVEREAGLLDEAYWAQVAAGGIDHFLRGPRDVTRLANAVLATLPAVRGEVNPVDFIVLETIRLYCRPAYDAIRRWPDAFLLPAAMRRAETGQLAVTQEIHERWRELVPVADRPSAEFLVMRLFPRLTDVLGARQIGAEPEESWRSLLRICAPEIFSVYVQLSIPRGAISNADLQSRLDHIGDANQFAATLLELARDSSPDAPQRLRAFLERLEAHLEQADGEDVASALQAVFQAADDLLRREDQRGVDGDVDAATQIRRLVRRLVMRIDQTERVGLLEHAFGTEGSLATIVDTIVMIGQEHGKYGGEWKEGQPTIVTLSQLAQVENLGLSFVRDAAADGKLLRVPRMPDVLLCWATWNRGECRAWVARTIDTDEGLLNFLGPFIREAGMPSNSVRGPKVANRLDHRRLRPFLEPSTIVERVRELAEADERTENERQVMRRYVLDHELLQQASSAEYAEGDPGEDRYAA